MVKEELSALEFARKNNRTMTPKQAANSESSHLQKQLQ